MTIPSDALLGAAEIRRLAAALELRPTRTWGQNFVHDANTIRRIIDVAAIGPDDHVLEVGPGLGSLTLGLLQVAATVQAVEIDPRLAGQLPDTVDQRLPGRATALTVLATDALTITAADLAHPPDTLVANLPYNIAVPVLLHLFAALPTLHRALVMVQAEVADRLVAPPGSRTYGVPSAKIAWYGTARRAGSVPRAVFWPVPGVDSALVSIVRRDNGYDVALRPEVFAVIDAAFAQRRKTLRAALTRWAGSAVEAERRCRAADIDPRARGETLSIDQFVALAGQR